jgi:pimeloyl-ACP methyl ester carboxylesterase
VARQTMAVLTQPDRTRDLGRLTMPTTVVHSLGDKMVNVSGGRATSMAIPGSELLLIDGMGHDLPEALWGTIATAIRETADRVTKAV